MVLGFRLLRPGLRLRIAQSNLRTPRPKRPRTQIVGLRVKGWVLAPLSNSWIISIIWYIALNRSPDIDPS